MLITIITKLHVQYLNVNNNNNKITCTIFECRPVFIAISNTHIN